MDLRKYVVGIKPKDKEDLILADNATDICEEDKFVLLIPESEFKELVAQQNKEGKREWIK